MGAASKIIAGIILIAIGLYLLVPSAWIGMDKSFGSGIDLDWGDDFVVLLKGAIPPVIILAGLILVIISRD